MRTTIRHPLPISCNFSDCTLEEASIRLYAAAPDNTKWPLTLYVVVHPEEFRTAKRVLSMAQARTKDNPLAPYINLRIDSSLGQFEWWLGYEGGIEVGSKGV